MFPTDDMTLAILESACGTSDDGRTHLYDVLDQPDDTTQPCTCVEDEHFIDAVDCKRHLGGWSPQSVILALIAEVKRLRDS
jgi:hypothetical protein